jgi:hypothetical protein
MVELKSDLVGWVRKSNDKRVFLVNISKEALKKVKTTKIAGGIEFYKLSVNLVKVKEIINDQRELTSIVAIKKNPVVKLKDPKRAVGETGEVYYPQKKKWMRGKIIGISDIRRAPFLSMSGYSEIPIYKVKLYTGKVIETSPIMMRNFRHPQLKSNPLIEYYKEVIK